MGGYARQHVIATQRTRTTRDASTFMFTTRLFVSGHCVCEPPARYQVKTFAWSLPLRRNDKTTQQQAHEFTNDSVRCDLLMGFLISAESALNGSWVPQDGTDALTSNVRPFVGHPPRTPNQSITGTPRDNLWCRGCSNLKLDMTMSKLYVTTRSVHKRRFGGKPKTKSCQTPGLRR